MIVFDSVTKVFDKGLGKAKVEVLKEVSFALNHGCVTGFLGANGAGKTTTIKIIMDIIRPTSGDVYFDEDLGVNFKEIANNIGFLPERPYFYPFMTGYEFLNYLGKLSQLSRGDIRDKITKFGDVLKIEFALDRKIESYSKGMLQRLGFLATLIHDPKLVILDEPLSGLDPIGRRDLKNLIVELRNLGKTVFFSSHIVSDVEEVCDDILFLKDGAVSYSGKLEDLVKDYENKDFRAIYRNVEELHNRIIKVEDLYGFLGEITAQKYHLISIEKEKMSLEEIVYQVKNHE